MSWALSAITGNPAVNFLRMSGVWNAFKPAGGGTLSQEGEFSDDEFFKFHGWFENVWDLFPSSVGLSQFSQFSAHFWVLSDEYLMIPTISYPSLHPHSICRVWGSCIVSSEMVHSFVARPSSPLIVKAWSMAMRLLAHTWHQAAVNTQFAIFIYIYYHYDYYHYYLLIMYYNIMAIFRHGHQYFRNVAKAPKQIQWKRMTVWCFGAISEVFSFGFANGRPRCDLWWVLSDGGDPQPTWTRWMARSTELRMDSEDWKCFDVPRRSKIF